MNLVNTYEEEGFEVHHCQTAKKGFLRKHIDLYKQYKSLRPTPHTLLVTFPGYYLMPLAWFLTRYPRKQLIFDAFISISDTMVSDRKLVSWINPLAWVYYLADIISCHLADEVLIDTQAHKEFFARRFFLKRSRIRVIYVGTREDLFHPGPSEGKLPKNKFNVLFIGSYIPLQGIEYILHAAKILKDHKDIHFTLIGRGQTYDEMTTLAKKLQLPNVTFLDFMPLEQLPTYLRSADCALGIFGLSDKADRVIAHKVYDAIACGIPLVTARNRAIEERFTDGKEVFLCEAGSPNSIANKILELRP